MGEAVYYARAVFPSAEEAEEAAPKVNAFLHRMAKCEDRWQELRSPFQVARGRVPDLPEELIQLANQISTLEAQGQRERVKEVEFSKQADAILRQEYPDVFEALEISLPDREQLWHGLNYLAGKLDSPANDPDWEIYVLDNEVRFEGMVWHFADWEPLMMVLKNRFGATSAGYVSDEWADLYNAIPMA